METIGRILNFARSQRSSALTLIALLGTACAPHPATAGDGSAGASYVALGSSFAAGPGVSTYAVSTPARCTRSIDNYAHQLARSSNLDLVDVSCSGAVIDDLFRPSGLLPAQLDALTPQTRLVTVTIGGNDVSYIGNLVNATIAYLPRKPGDVALRPVLVPSEQSWRALEGKMEALVTEVRHRSPLARLIFVDYAVILPPKGTCAATPLSAEDADQARRTASRLAILTARVARRGRAELIQASQLTRDHDACSIEPWVNGYIMADGPKRWSSYHPNILAMTEIGRALSERWRSPSRGRTD